MHCNCEQDPEFWQTVHESGAIQKQREQEVQDKEQVRQMTPEKLLIMDMKAHAAIKYPIGVRKQCKPARCMVKSLHKAGELELCGSSFALDDIH